jgi:hypothetical protein
VWSPGLAILNALVGSRLACAYCQGPYRNDDRHPPMAAPKKAKFAT